MEQCVAFLIGTAHYELNATVTLIKDREREISAGS